MHNNPFLRIFIEVLKTTFTHLLLEQMSPSLQKRSLKKKKTVYGKRSLVYLKPYL